MAAAENAWTAKTGEASTSTKCGRATDSNPTLLIGYFEGLDAERAIAWRAAVSFALREFLGLGTLNPDT